MYYIKFKDNTWLTKPELPFANYYSDGNDLKYDNTNAMEFNNLLSAWLVSLILGNCHVTTKDTPLRYELDKKYLTNNGGVFRVTEVHENFKGYETVSDGKSGRYNRTTGGWDNGRTTGSRLTGDCLVYPPQEIKE